LWITRNNRGNLWWRGGALFVELRLVFGLLLLMLPVGIRDVHWLVAEQVRLHLLFLLLPGTVAVTTVSACSSAGGIDCVDGRIADAIH